MDAKTFILGVADALDFTALTGDGVRIQNLRAVIAAYSTTDEITPDDAELDAALTEVIDFFVSRNVAKVRGEYLYAAHLDAHLQEEGN